MPEEELTDDAFYTAAYTSSKVNIDDDGDFIPIQNEESLFIKTQKRLSGVTKESFLNDLNEWAEIHKALPTVDGAKIREELSEMDVSIPADQYDFSALQKCYSRLTAYRFRIVFLFDVINQRFEFYSLIYKAVKSGALPIFSGGTVKDRESNAEGLAGEFLIGIIETKPLMECIIEMKSSIEMACNNLSRILREKEALSRISNRYNEGGMADDFNEEASEIKTRN